MGWGHYCIASKALGFDVHGCELSDVRIKFAQMNGVKIIKNINELEDNYFDFINSEQVFEHLSDPSVIMKEFQRILKNDGVINISVPNSVKSIKDLNSSVFNIIRVGFPVIMLLILSDWKFRFLVSIVLYSFPPGK